MARFLVVLARRPAGDACPGLGTPWAASIAICAFLAVLWPFDRPPANPLAKLSFGSALLPVGIGLIVTLLAVVGLRLTGLRIEPVRPGEVLALFSSDNRPGLTLPPLPHPAIHWQRHLATLRRVDALPARAETWAVGGAVAVAIVVAMALLERPATTTCSSRFHRRISRTARKMEALLPQTAMAGEVRPVFVKDAGFTPRPPDRSEHALLTHSAPASGA